MLEPGYYTNMFEVKLSREEVEFMVCERSRYPSLKTIRSDIERFGKEILLYAPVKSKRIFGCGRDFEWLASKGFQKETIKLTNEPRLTGRLILEGIMRKSKEIGFFPMPEKEKWRITLFNENNFTTTSDDNIYIYKCYDLRVIYLKDVTSNTLKFYAIIDVKFLFRDKTNKPLNTAEIVRLYGSYMLKEIRVLQKDLVRVNEKFKANTEVSRQRLLEDLIPFVEKVKEFFLPCNVRAHLNTLPCRIMMVI